MAAGTVVSTTHYAPARTLLIVQNPSGAVVQEWAAMVFSDLRTAPTGVFVHVQGDQGAGQRAAQVVNLVHPHRATADVDRTGGMTAFNASVNESDERLVR
jgi:hypothetical protein